MKKVMIVLFICLILFVSSCAKATSYESATTVTTTVLNSIPYDAIKNLSVGEYIKFELGLQVVKSIRLLNGYLFITTTSGWTDAGITSTFVSENDF